MTRLQSEHHDELRRILAHEPEEAWRDIVALWASADRVYTAPAGPNGFIHPAYELAVLVCDEVEAYLPYLTRDITNPNANVCAYCLTCLERAGKLNPTAKQRDELLQRTDVLDVVTGCFGSTPTLARFLELKGKAYL